MIYDHNIQTVDLVSDLTALAPVDGQICNTLGYSLVGSGANRYRYEAGSSAVCDGGFILDGVGGSNTPGLTAATYAGTGTGRFIAVDQAEANAKQFGAKGDGVTDDTFRVKAATASAQTTGAHLLFPTGAAAYLVTDTISSDGSINIQMEGYLLYSGTQDRPILHITGAVKRDITVSAKNSGTGTWANESHVAVLFENAIGCRIDVKEAFGCTVGLRMLGNAGGCAYNRVQLGHMLSNMYAVDLRSEGTGGYSNQNNFYGGRFTVASGITARARYGVRSYSPNDNQNNGNTFYSPSFELLIASATPEEALPMLLTDALDLRVYNARDEANGPFFARVEEESRGIHITKGYDDDVFSFYDIDHAGNYADTQVEGARIGSVIAKQLLFNSGPLAENYSYHTVASPWLSFRGLQSINSTGALKTFAADAVIVGDYAQVNGVAIGRRIDTETVKRFRIDRAVSDNLGGRLLVACYDAGGTQLTIADGNLVRGINTYSASYGGVWKQGADTEKASVIEVDSQVKSVLAAVVGGTAPARIKEFSIVAVDEPMLTYIDTPEMDHDLFSDAAPTAGTWAARKRIYNRTPVGGSAAGWICITAGTPGTWKAFGTLAA